MKLVGAIRLQEMCVKSIRLPIPSKVARQLVERLQ